MPRLASAKPILILCALAAQACSPTAQTEPFSLRFAAVSEGKTVGCTDELQGFGPSPGYRVGLNDLRLYISNLRFQDDAGSPLAVELDRNEFQYAAPEGAVAMIDLTGTAEGSCASTSVAFAEGTARTHGVVTGQAPVGAVASVSFDVGVPQALMKKTIASSTPEGAPSPLNEMYWNWNSGYRHLVLNFAVRDAAGATGGGYVHVGSRDCGQKDGKALEDRDSCTFVNNPAVKLSSFNLAKDTVGIDLRRLLAGIDFKAPIYDPKTYEVIGEGPGVECHSAPDQPDCGPIFSELGLDLQSGKGRPETNLAFVRLR